MDIRIEQKDGNLQAPPDTKLVIWLTSQLNHNIHNLSYAQGILHGLCTILLLEFEEGVFNYGKTQKNGHSKKLCL